MESFENKPEALEQNQESPEREEQESLEQNREAADERHSGVVPNEDAQRVVREGEQHAQEVERKARALLDQNPNYEEAIEMTDDEEVKEKIRVLHNLAEHPEHE